MDPEDTKLFVDPVKDAGEEDESEDAKLEIAVELLHTVERDEEEEEEEEDDKILTEWLSRRYGPREMLGKEGKMKRPDRKTSFNPMPARPFMEQRRNSLPCPEELIALQLSRLQEVSSRASRPARAPRPQVVHEPAKPANMDHRPSVIAPLPELDALRLKRTRFRRRTVMSMSDADRVCLICHGDLNKGQSGIRQLHCSHSFHSECIEDWLWQKQECPTCRVHIPMPEPLYWGSARVKVP